MPMLKPAVLGLLALCISTQAQISLRKSLLDEALVAIAHEMQLVLEADRLAQAVTAASCYVLGCLRTRSDITCGLFVLFCVQAFSALWHSTDAVLITAVFQVAFLWHYFVEAGEGFSGTKSADEAFQLLRDVGRQAAYDRVMSKPLKDRASELEAIKTEQAPPPLSPLSPLAPLAPLAPLPPTEPPSQQQAKPSAEEIDPFEDFLKGAENVAAATAALAEAMGTKDVAQLKRSIAEAKEARVAASEIAKAEAMLAKAEPKAKAREVNAAALEKSPIDRPALEAVIKSGNDAKLDPSEYADCEDGHEDVKRTGEDGDAGGDRKRRRADEVDGRIPREPERRDDDRRSRDWDGKGRDGGRNRDREDRDRRDREKDGDRARRSDRQDEDPRKVTRDEVGRVVGESREEVAKRETEAAEVREKRRSRSRGGSRSRGRGSSSSAQKKAEAAAPPASEETDQVLEESGWSKAKKAILFKEAKKQYEEKGRIGWDTVREAAGGMLDEFTNPNLQSKWFELKKRGLCG